MFFKKNKKTTSNTTSTEIEQFLVKEFGIQNSSLLNVSMGSVKHNHASDDNQAAQTFTIHFPFVFDSLWSECEQKLKQQFGQHCVFEKHYNVPIFTSPKPPIANIKNIIAVSSGKGGVGKSASALNLALALKHEGARVGILDADIYGPSIPIMLGTVEQQPESPNNKTMYPIQAHGLVSNSIGYLVKNEHASIWRGPMASKALQQLITETQWPMLDYLIVDMPPGTGDIQLTMCQLLPLTAAVVVTTPQDLALSDAGKGIAMFDQLHIPVLGIIENMSYFECGYCHQKTPIFSENGAQKLSDKYALPLLAQIPLDPIIREYADAGKALLDDLPEHAISIAYKQAAIDLTRNLCKESEVSPLASQMENNIQITQLD